MYRNPYGKNGTVAEYEDSWENPPYILIKITDRMLAERQNDLYETVRKYWNNSLDHAKQYVYVLGVKDEIVQEVYHVDRWFLSEEYLGRIEFVGEVAPDEIRNRFIHRRIPAFYRCRSAFVYCHLDN